MCFAQGFLCHVHWLSLRLVTRIVFSPKQLILDVCSGNHRALEIRLRNLDVLN